MTFHRQLKSLSDADLRRHLELERKRSEARHWCYSLPRHQAILDEVKRRENEARRAA
jgi:hypothetical protein